MTSPTTTSHLLSLYTPPSPGDPTSAHPFLTAAGNGTLPKDALALWLAQDRIYAAHAYPRFVGALLCKIPFRSTDAISSSATEWNERVLRLLSYALQNVVREAGFFREAAEKFGLDIKISSGATTQQRGWKERKATRDYTAEMARIGALGTLEEGLVFLWGMERVYLDSWKCVKSLSATWSATGPSNQAIANFVENWTSPEFECFVEECAEVVNTFSVSSDAAETAWRRVLELEEAFWPADGEERR